MVRDACMQELDHAKLQSKPIHCPLGQLVWYQIVVHCGTLEVIVSGSTKSAITSKIRRRLNHEEIVHVILTKPSSKVDIFTKLVNANVPKPLRSLCSRFDAATLL